MSQPELSFDELLDELGLLLRREVAVALGAGTSDAGRFAADFSGTLASIDEPDVDNEARINYVRFADGSGFSFSRETVRRAGWRSAAGERELEIELENLSLSISELPNRPDRSSPLAVSLELDGYPPAKGEAMSMLGSQHSHAPRVKALLRAAQDALAEGTARHLRGAAIHLAVEVRCPRDRLRSDATNYLGGIADVLEEKGHRASLEHLGPLVQVALYDNDRQIEEASYRWVASSDPSYSVWLRPVG